MGGLGANTFYNIAIGLSVIVARYGAIVPTMALAGALGPIVEQLVMQARHLF